MQPLYFLPGVSRQQLAPVGQLNRGLLESRGLADVFADVFDTGQDATAVEVVGTGPGGKSGVILAYNTPAGEPPRRCGYYPQEQTWTAIPTKCKGPHYAPPADSDVAYFIGVHNDEPPQPEEMLRKRTHDSRWLELDGQQWLIPTIRRPDGSTGLPRDVYWDERGRVVEPVKAAYRQLWEDQEQVMRWFIRGGEPGWYGHDSGDYSLAVGLDLAVRIIGLHYRFGRAEQNLLRVIDAMTLVQVLSWSIDLPTYISLYNAQQQKKTSSPSTDDATSISPGAEASSPDIDPPAAS